MKTRLLVLLLLAGSSMFAATHVFVGIGVGGYGYGPGYYVAPPPPPVAVYASPCPGPGYAWVPGYWYRVGPRSFWRAGYWAFRPHGRVVRPAPRYYGRYGYRR